MDRNSRTGAIPRRSRPLGANPRPRTGALLRALLAAGVLSLSAGAARASVLVSIDKSTQRMSVSVDGVPRYHWAVSTGRAATARRAAPIGRSEWSERGFRRNIIIRP